MKANELRNALSKALGSDERIEDDDLVGAVSDLVKIASSDPLILVLTVNSIGLLNIASVGGQITIEVANQMLTKGLELLAQQKARAEMEQTANETELTIEKENGKMDTQVDASPPPEKKEPQ